MFYNIFYFIIYYLFYLLLSVSTFKNREKKVLVKYLFFLYYFQEGTGENGKRKTNRLSNQKRVKTLCKV